MPFESLLSSKKGSEKKDYRTLDYFINNHSIKYVLTPANFTNSVKQLENDVTIFSPSFSNHGYSDLPFSQSIGDKLKEEFSYRYYSNELADLENFINCKSPLIQLNTHSIVEQDVSLNHLTFTVHKLLLSETEQLNNWPELIILNSCNSGNGRPLMGDGIKGFVREFHKLGVRASISNLWEVDDKASNELFYSFHQLINKGKNSTELLREAKLVHIKNASNSELGAPYYWAGHHLIGGDVCFERNKSTSSNSWLYLMFGGITVILVLTLFRKRNR